MRLSSYPFPVISELLYCKIWKVKKKKTMKCLGHKKRISFLWSKHWQTPQNFVSLPYYEIQFSHQHSSTTNHRLCSTTKWFYQLKISIFDNNMPISKMSTFLPPYLLKYQSLWLTHHTSNYHFIFVTVASIRNLGTSFLTGMLNLRLNKMPKVFFFNLLLTLLKST